MAEKRPEGNPKSKPPAPAAPPWRFGIGYFLVMLVLLLLSTLMSS